MRFLIFSIVLAFLTSGCGVLAPDDPDFSPAARGSVGPSADQTDPGGEVFSEWIENGWVDAQRLPVSTFSADVDTASYTYGRSQIRDGSLPESKSVRVEEYVNYFDYEYGEPEEGAPFGIDLEVSPSRFGPEGSELLRIGVRAPDIPIADMKPTTIVLTFDTSYSMSGADELGLAKESALELVRNLRPTDRVGVVVFGSGAFIHLEPTEVANTQAIENAIRTVAIDGATDGWAGLNTAFAVAKRHQFPDGNNRVVLMTDGDFNVGETGQHLIDYIIEQRDDGVALTVVGYGDYNLKDYRLERIAHEGNGNYYFCDSLDEARRIFGSELTSTMEIVASDVKFQIEFEPTTVARYRLIGYENPLLENGDFDDDTIDAADVGAGRSVTAFYEIVLRDGVDRGLLATGRARYKYVGEDESQEIEEIIKLSSRTEFEEASREFRFGAAVAEFAEILRESRHADGRAFDAIREVAEEAMYENDPKQREFLGLVEEAEHNWH